MVNKRKKFSVSYKFIKELKNKDKMIDTQAIETTEIHTNFPPIKNLRDIACQVKKAKNMIKITKLKEQRYQ